MEVSGQPHGPATLPPGKESVVSIGDADKCGPEPVWTLWRWQIFSPCRESNLNSSTVEPIARRYTDWAMSDPYLTESEVKW
jgi:hypothetical protein